jgi:hypothetical protein
MPFLHTFKWVTGLDMASGLKKKVKEKCKSEKL